jgi:peptidyl-tRNA hydrolase, PTH1 family
MKLLIGLGNPGERYEGNRHSVGKMLIRRLKKDQIFFKDLILIESDTFMNDSGRFVAEKFFFYKITPDDLYIVHDDLDLPLGQFKIQKGIGPKVHNGVNNIEQALGTKDFWRIRIGVDNRDPQKRIAGEDYVLQDFTKEELGILKGVFDAIVKNSPF